jgi:DNA-directed RNA polymerase subunit alpha
VVEPLERGFGYTLGNCMRRVLLSSLPGAAATSIRVEGIQHEFASIEGVREDVTDIVLNVKGLVFRDSGIGAGRRCRHALGGWTGGRDRSGPQGSDRVRAGQPGARDRDAERQGQARDEHPVGVGRGYVSADRNKRAEDPIGVITVDSLFSPVVALHLHGGEHACRSAHRLRQAHLEVETNGSIDPGDAVARAGRIIDEHMMLFVDQAVDELSDEGIFAAAVDESESVLDTPIEELDLSVRSYNCLKRQGVNTIGQLTECSEQDLLNIRNFGAKSIEEVKDKLQQMNLGLKQ